MLVTKQRHIASAGANTVVITMPVGSTVYVIKAHNNTKNWTKAIIAINSDKKLDWASQLSLVQDEIQCGHQPIIWQGEPFRIESPFMYILGYFYDADLSDILYLEIGYEPSAKKGWWPC